MPLLPSNPTQWAGLAACSFGALACAMGARRTHSAHDDPPATGTSTRVWLGLAGLQAWMTLDVMFDIRHHLHNAADSWLMAMGLYAQRVPLQLMLIGGVIAAGGTGLLLGIRLTRHLPDRLALRVAIAGTAGAMTSFALEMASLHAVDAWMYSLWGPVMRIGWLWCALALPVIAGALQAGPMQNARRTGR